VVDSSEMEMKLLSQSVVNVNNNQNAVRHLTMKNDRWRVSWKRQKKVNGFTSTQSVIVYGIDNVEHIIKTVVPTDEWDVTPA